MEEIQLKEQFDSIVAYNAFPHFCNPEKLMKQGSRGVGLQKMTLSAMFLAIGLILPFFTGQIPQIGSMLLPMHIPVLVKGLNRTELLPNSVSVTVK